MTEEEREQLLQEELARPIETHNQRAIRKIEERNALRAIKREAETMADLEARLNAKIAYESDRVLKSVAKVLAEKIAGPHDKQIAELRDRVDSMKGRDGVSVVGAAIDRTGQIMFTLSDGTVLRPGPVAASSSKSAARLSRSLIYQTR